MAHRITLKTTTNPRYDTLGDWTIDNRGNIHIEVTGMDVLSPEGFLIALHELVEVMLCRQRGITQQAVDDFDMAFKGDGEPGDEPDAPYRREHQFANKIENMVAHEMGMAGYGDEE